MTLLLLWDVQAPGASADTPAVGPGTLPVLLPYFMLSTLLPATLSHSHLVQLLLQDKQPQEAAVCLSFLSHSWELLSGRCAL